MRTIALAALLPLLAACASVGVDADWDHTVDFSAYRSWNWLPSSRTQTDVSGGLSEIARGRIERAVEREITARGFPRNEAAPDLLATYFVTVEERIEVTDWGHTSTVYPYARYRGHGATSMGWRDVDVRTTREGVLIVDLIDAKAKTLVWRGTARGTLGDSEQNAKKIDEAAVKLFAEFPPKR
jgi:hypothetical protein